MILKLLFFNLCSLSFFLCVWLLGGVFCGPLVAHEGQGVVDAEAEGKLAVALAETWHKPGVGVGVFLVVEHALIFRLPTRRDVLPDVYAHARHKASPQDMRTLALDA